MNKKSRLVRVFISSTFRDFMGERDELVKKVFPELRRRCKSRFVELLEVDLRWGITEEQSKQGDTLRICLEEIDKCRPSAPVFFIGLLGERYGWIPEADFYPESVLEDEHLGWVKEHIGGKSVTELEILHGVLNNSKMGDKAFFYFRNTGYERRHWEEIVGEYHDLKQEDFTNELEADPGAAEQKQELLKEAIRNSGLNHDPKDYETPVELADFVREDIWNQIDSIFPADEVPDELERQRLDHEVFGASRLKGYVQRAGFLEALDEVIKPDGPPVKVVTGESGGGKSALLASWIEHAATNLPECHFIHYIGGATESGSLESVVFRLMKTIRQWGVVDDNIPDDMGEAVELLPEWLRMTARAKPGGVLIVLDALDQLENEQDLELRWLPEEAVSGVKWVLSTLPGPCLDALSKRGWLTSGQTVNVPGLNQDERREIISRYLAVYTKRLAPPLVERLSSAPQTSNALFLKVLLDELRLRARHEELAVMTDTLLQAKDPVELFVMVLKNLEELDVGRKDLVREAMGILHAARRGLTEGELMELLSDHDEPSTHPLARSLWSPLYLALDSSLIERNGRLGFFHDYLRLAVEREYLDEDWERRRVHGRLGDVALAWDSERFSPTLRRYGLAHGAWHMKMIGQHEELWNILHDDGFRAAQRQEFTGIYEITESLKNGISVYSLRKGEVESDDARLGRMVLSCGEAVQGMHSNLRDVYEDCMSVDSAIPNRLETILTKLKSLDSTAFFHACLFLVYNESVRGGRGGGSVSGEFFKAVEEEISARIDGEIEVVAEVFQESLAKVIPHDFWEFLKSKCRIRKSICEFFEVNLEDDFEHFDGSFNDDADSEEDAVLAEDAMNLVGQNDWSGAMEISSQIVNPQNRSDLLYTIAQAQSENQLLEESLHTFALACTQDAQPSQRDWNSMGELCFAIALEISRKEALELANTIEDAQVRSKTIARIASLSWPDDREEAICRFRTALEEAATLGESGFYVDAINEILSEINHPEIVKELRAEIIKSVGKLEDDQWRSSGLESLAENQSRLGVFSKSLRAVKNIPRHDSKARSYASLALACYAREKIKHSACLFDASMRSVISCKADYAKAEVLTYLADCLSQVGDFNGKDNLLEKALEAASSLRDTRESATALCSIAQALSPSELAKVKEQITDAGSFWCQFHMQVAVAPALIKAGQLKEARETIEAACRHIKKIESEMSRQDAAEALDFLISTCCKIDAEMDFLDPLLHGGIISMDLAIPGYDSNYVGLVELMSKYGLYKEALQCVPEILQGTNRVKALSGLVDTMTRSTEPSMGIVDLIGFASQSQNDCKFLLNLESLYDCKDDSIEWIRCFTRLCPENINIGFKLITDLITMNIRAGKMGAARQIIQLCPELEISALLDGDS